MNTEKENMIEEFSKWQKDQGKADGTIKTYVGVLEKYESWLSSRGKSLNDLSKNDVQLYMDALEEQQKTAGTIEKYLAAISVFARYLDRSDIVLDIRRKEKEKDTEVPESLEASDEKKLLQEVKVDGNIRNIAIVYTLLYTGIRISELCALNFDDIQEVDGKKKLIIKDKNGEIDRVIPLSKEASHHLDKYIRSLTSKRDAVFVTSVNKRISARAIQYMLQKYDVNPHKLRHTFCQKLINKGIDLHTVAQLAGHRDINVTKRYVGSAVVNLENAIDQAFS